MARNQVHVAMSAANAQIVQAWLQANKGPQQMLKLLQDIGGKGQRAGQQASGGIEKIASSVSRAIGSFIGIGTAIQGIGTAAGIVRREWEQLKQVQAQAFESQLPAQRELAALRLLGLPAGLEHLADPLRERAAQARTPIPLNERLRTMGVAISAGTSEIEEDVRQRAENGIRTLELLGTALENMPTVLDEIARSVTVIREGFPEASAEEAISTFLNALVTSPGGIPNISQFAENITPAAVNLGAKGFSLRDAFSLLVGVQARTQDVQGATTRTNVFQLIETLDKKLTEAGRPDLAGMAMLEFITKSTDPVALKLNAELLRGQSRELRKISRDSGTTIATLQEQLGIQKAKFDDEIQARARGKFAIVELLQRETAEAPPGGAKERVEQARAAIRPAQEAVEDIQRRVREGRESPNQLLLEARAIVKETTESLKQRPGAAERDFLSQTIEEMLPLLGDTAFATGITSMVERLKTAEATPLETMRQLIETFQFQMDKLSKGEAVGGRVFTRVLEPTAEQQETVSLLRQMVDRLQILVDGQRMRMIPMEVPRPTPGVPPVITPTQTEAAAVGFTGGGSFGSFDDGFTGGGTGASF